MKQKEEKKSCVIGLKNTKGSRSFDSMPLKLLSLKYDQILKIKMCKDVFTSLLYQNVVEWIVHDG